MEGDADRFAREFLYEQFRRALDKRAQGECIRDEWNSGCARLELWQAHIKLVSSCRIAVKELSDLPGMTTWAYVVLMGHRNEITGYLLSKAEDARLDRWTSVGYAKQVLGRASTKGAITILSRCKKCGLMPKDDVMWCLNEEKGSCEISQSPQEVLLCIVRCSQ